MKKEDKNLVIASLQEQLAQYPHFYITNIEGLNAEKTTYFLRLIVMLVMVIGLIISTLSFYILMLSIYLLVQKNTEKLQNLLLIGYSPSKVARPYQLLTVSLNVIVLIIAMIVVIAVRTYYMNIIADVYPELANGTLLPMIVVGIALFLLVTILNVFIIYRKIIQIWFKKA